MLGQKHNTEAAMNLLKLNEPAEAAEPASETSEKNVEAE